MTTVKGGGLSGQAGAIKTWVLVKRLVYMMLVIVQLLKENWIF